LRILAAVCIAFTHSFNLLGRNTDEPLMALTGQRYDFSFIGLCIFFSISGYLITRSACTSTSFLNYCWKRFLRIQPLLIIVTLISIFIVGPVFTSLATGEYFSSTSTWTYLRNIFPATGVQFTLPGVFTGHVDAGVNGSLWTLVIEERLYLLVSILFFLKGFAKRSFILMIWLINIFYMLHCTVFHHTLIGYFEKADFFFALLFLNSGVLYLMGIPFDRSTLKKLLIVFPVLLTALVFSQVFFLQILAIPFFVIGLAHLRGITNRAGQQGDFTYGVYIFAFPVQQILIALGGTKNNPWLLFGETMLIVLPLAIISWHLIEKKFLEKKKLVR